MKKILAALLFSLSLFGVDYDCIIIGSSPICLFEALYQYGSGKKVLIVDESESCGGVWKSIEICGIENVDVGCHEIGNNKHLREFLEVYAGCQMVSTGTNDCFYFSKGCYELIHHLEEMIGKTTIDLLLNTRVTQARIDEKCVWVQMGDQNISTDKVYLCGYSFLNIGTDAERQVQKSKYFHLYLLIADSTPPRFSYQNGGTPHVSRMMNLTRFVGLENTCRQLIVFQTDESNLQSGEKFLSELKKSNLVDNSAYILKGEPYIYEQWPSNNLRGLNSIYFETLQTYDFRSMTHYFKKWKEVLKPYAEIIHHCK
jgi:hypothetical protein